MTFGNIYWLYAFIPVFLILLLGFWYSQKKRQYFFETFVAPKLQKSLMATYSPGRHFLKSLLFLLAIFFLFLALAQPRWGYEWQEQKSKGIDILFALDVSKSMLAEDIKPNRLERSKYAILDLTQKLEGDRFGLITFAGNAFLQCPLTLDYNAFRESLEQADPSVIYQGGTNIGAAIRTAEPVFSKEDNFKILILITDGEDLEQSGVTAATHAAKNDIKIYTVGVGTTQGELIPIKDKNNAPDFLRDPSGNVVKTKLDEKVLKEIAEITGGFYVSLGPKGEGLNEIYQKGLKSIPKQELSSNLKQVPLEQFQWPLAIAILLLGIEMLLSTRKKVKTNASSLLSLTILAFFILILSNHHLNASVTDAYKAYQEGQFEKSATLYQKAQKKDPENFEIYYNLGNSLYKSGDYNFAINALNNAIKTQDLELQQKAFYNLGNAYFRSGELSLQTNPKQTTELWESALKSYQNAIELNPQDAESHENLEFVKKKLEELQQQQQENKNNENQNQQDKQNQQESENQQNQNNPENKNQNNSNNNSNNNQENKDNQENQESGNQSDKQNQNENAEAPPKEEPNTQSHSSPEPQNGNADQDKSNSSNSKSQPESTDNGEETEQVQQSNQQNHRPMNEEEARELLKTLQNSEKKLPAVGYSEENSDRRPTNFKDW